MGDKTGIEWTDSSWNVVRGCRRVSDGCRFCYAEKVAHRFCGEGQPYEGLTVEGKARWNGEVRFEASHLLDPMRWGKPRRIFVNSMSDVFFESFTNEQIAAQFAIMTLASHHQFQVLTKRPERMDAWLSWIESTGDIGETLRKALVELLPDGVLETSRSALTQRLKRGLVSLAGMGNGKWADRSWPLPNVLLGVSVEHQQAADERCDLLVKQTRAGWKTFLSCEPLIGPVSLAKWLAPDESGAPGLDWIIAGGESGDPDSRPCHPSWVRTIRDECKATGVPFFFKQWGDHLPDPGTQLGSAPTDHVTFDRTGNKKLNGAMLDGVEHKDWPAWVTTADQAG